MRRLGFLIAAVGIVVIFAALMMDTTIATESGARVNNLSRMADRQLYTLLGGVVLVAGVIMALLASRHLSAARPCAESVFETRPCPGCAAAIKLTATHCKHCGVKVTPLPVPTLVNGWVACVKFTTDLDLEHLKAAIRTEGYPAVSMQASHWGAGPFATREEAQEALSDLQAGHSLGGRVEYRDALSGKFPSNPR